MKKILSLVLVLTILFGMLPPAVQASPVQTQLTNNDLTIDSTNSFGALLSDEITQQTESYSGSYNVVGLTVEAGVATVTLDTIEQATLVVAVYTEDGSQLLLSANTTVQAGQTSAQVTLPEGMPQYYLISAFLLDLYDNSPLCAAYETQMYTRQMQELLDSTVEDYDPDRVLNLDESTETNFAVYSDTTTVIEAEEGVNTVALADDDTATYVIENADESFLSLTPGEIIAYPYGDDEILIIKVASVSVSGTTVTIQGDDLEMEDVFDYVKIEADADTENLTVDTSTADEGITYEGLLEEPATYKEEGSISAKRTLSYAIEKTVKNDTASITVSGGLRISVEFKFDYYIALKRQELSLRITPGVKAFLSVSGEIKALDLPLGHYGASPVPGVYIGVAPKLQLKFSGKLEFSGNYTTTIGVGYISGKGFQNLCTTPKSEVYAEAEGTIFFGVDLEPELLLLGGKLAEIELGAPIGVEITAKMTGTDMQASAPTEEQIHGCEKCLDIDIVAKGELEGKVKFLKCKRLTYTCKFVSWEIKVCDFYWSLDYDEFKLGTCPHVAYRVTVLCEDPNGSPIAGQSVQASTLDEPLTTDNNGLAVLYVQEGEAVTLSADQPDMSCSKTITVEEAQKAVMRMAYKDHVIADQGQCGENLTWTLTYGGTLTISGDGAMYDFASQLDVPWFERRETVKTVVFDGNITHLGSYAFAACLALPAITVPDTVTSVGPGVFLNCTALQAATLPETVTVLPASAFSGCTFLRDLTLSSLLTAFGDHALSGCKYLTVLPIPETVTTIGEGAFAGCTGLRSFTFPTDLPAIGENAFQNITATVYYPRYNETYTPETMTTYGGNLTWIVYGNWGSGTCGDELSWVLAENGTLTVSGTGAMYDYAAENPAPWAQFADKLTTVVVESGATSIGSFAFDGCDALVTVYLPATVTRLGQAAFRNCTALTTISGTSGVTVIEDEALKNCIYLTSFTFCSDMTYVGSEAFYGCKRLCRATVSGSAPTVGDRAFYGCEKLEGVTLSGVTAIGKEVFYGCTLLSNVHLPNTLTVLGEKAFFGCTGLITATLSTQLAAIAPETFSGCTALTAVSIPSSVKTVGEKAFFGCSALKTLTLNSGLQAISDSSFSGCAALTAVRIPATLTQIGTEAFYGCTSLSTLTFGANVQTIGSLAFSGCAALTYVTIPASVTELGGQAFSDCTKLASVSLGSGITTIAPGTFENCPALKNLTLSQNLSAIGEKAFYGCTALASVVLPASLKTIDAQAFYGTAITALVFPEGFEALRTQALSGNTSLQKLTFAGTALSDAAGLADLTVDVWYPANDAAWEALISTLDAPNVRWIPYGTSEDGLYWYVTPEGVLTVSGSAAMTDYAPGSAPWYSYRDRIQQALLKGGITAIGSNGFYGCAALEKVTIPATVTAVNTGAFAGCTALAGVHITDAAAWCTVSFAAPEDNPLYYGKTLYVNGSVLTDLTIPASVTAVSKYAFYGCTSLQTVTATALTTIGEKAFYGCTALSAFDAGSKLQTVGAYAFSGCTALQSIFLPKTVTALESGCFADSGLTAVTFAYDPPAIAADAFQNVTATVNYPSYRHDWTAENMLSYGGTLTWEPYGYTASGTFGGTAITWSLTKYGVLTISGSGTMNNLATSTTPAPWYQYRETITSLVVEEGITGIGNYNFQLLYALEEVSLPGTLSKIGSYAFKTCTALKTITIPNSVTTMDSGVFQGCTGLESIQLSNTLTAISSYTFENCSALRQITIPTSVESIGYEAFCCCTALTEVTVPGSVSSINGRAFISCSGLTEVTLPEGVATIGHSAFYGCRKLEKIFLPASLTTVGDGAFTECSALTGVYIPDLAAWCGISFDDYYSNPLSQGATFYVAGQPVTELVIPEGVTSIGNYAFYNASMLTKVTFPSTLLTIGSNAFYKCTGLTEITLPDSVTSVGASAFAHCTNLVSADLGTVETLASKLFYGCTALEEVTLSNTYTKIYTEAFYNCSKLRSITIPTSVSSLGQNAFYNCTALEEVHITDLVAWNDLFSLASSGENPLHNGAALYLNGERVEHLVLPEEMTAVNPYAFEGCTGLLRVTIPSSVTKIGDYAFSGCPDLAEIHFPSTTVKLYGYAFNNCDALKTVTLDQIALQGSCVFFDCDGLTSVTVGANVTSRSTADAFFGNCDALTEASVACPMTSGFGYLFDSCSRLSQLTLAEGVVTLPMYMLRGCTALRNWTVPSTVTTVEAYALSTGSVMSVYFRGDAPTFKDDCVSGTNVTMYYPSGNTTWSNVSIYSGGSVTLRAYNPTTLSVRTAGQALLSAHRSQKAVVKPETEPSTQIQNGKTVHTVSFTNLVPGAQYVLIVTEDPNAPALDPDNLLYIRQTAAAEDGTLTFQYVQRKEAAGIVQLCGASDKDLASAQIVFPEMWEDGSLHEVDPAVTYAGQLLVEGQDYVMLGKVDYTVAGDFTCTIRGIRNYTGLVSCSFTVRYPDWKYVIYDDHVKITGYTGTDTDITVPATIGGKPVTVIGPEAFDSTGITSITLPDSVHTIEKQAFWNCGRLNTIHWGSSVQTIEEQAFWYCGGLTQVTIPASVTAIGDEAFAGCANLQSFTVEEGNTAFCADEQGVLYNLDKTKLIQAPAKLQGSYTVPEGVTTVGTYAFSSCSGLSEVILPESLEQIESYAFASCYGLTAVDVPDSVTAISEGAFAGCFQLKTVVLGESLATIGEAAFADCSGLQTVGYAGSKAQWEAVTVGQYNDCLLGAAFEYYYGKRIPGDINGDNVVTRDDVVKLLLHVTSPTIFTIDVPADFTGDGKVTREDVVKLLLFVTAPNTFPL